MDRTKARYGVRYKAGDYFAWFASLIDAKTFLACLVDEEGTGKFEITDAEGVAYTSS